MVQYPDFVKHSGKDLYIYNIPANAFTENKKENYVSFNHTNSRKYTDDEPSKLVHKKG